MLSIVGKALHRVYVSHRHDAQKRVLKEEHQRKVEEAIRRRQARMKEGTWHDGRLDCVSGNGIMSELGIGDEAWDSEQVAIDSLSANLEKVSLHDDKSAANKQAEETGKKITEAHIEAIIAMPIIVIRNFEVKAGYGMGLAAKADSREEILNVLANWAGSLVENQVAHVIVISDNRENAKRLSRGVSHAFNTCTTAHIPSLALGSKSLNSIALYDADPASSRAFVKQKLRDAGADIAFTGDESNYLQRLGGRASDLESVSGNHQPTSQKYISDIPHR